MTNELVKLSGSNLPAFVKEKAGTNILKDMGGGLAQSVPRISLDGKEFRLIKDGNELGKAPDRQLDVVIVGSSQHVHRAFFDKAYEKGEDILPTCFSHEGKVPDSTVEPKKRMSKTCSSCPKNAKQPDPRRPGKDYTPCSFSKNIAVMIPGDKTHTVWQLRLSSMSMFNNSSSLKEGVFTWRGLFNFLSSQDLSPLHVVVRLTFQDESVPVLNFQPIAIVGDDRTSYDEAYYNKAVWAVDEGIVDGVTGDSQRVIEDDQDSTEEPEPAKEEPVKEAEPPKEEKPEETAMFDESVEDEIDANTEEILDMFK